MVNIFGTSKAEALRAHLLGYPSALPDGNRWKGSVEDHRWGHHGILADKYCPACAMRDGVSA